MPPYTIPPEKLWAEIIRLANESDHSWRFTKKGDSRPLEDVERMKQSRRSNLAAKRERAAVRIEVARRARNRARILRAPGTSIADRMVMAMEPGQWYGSGDLARMIGESRSARGKVSQVLLKRKWVERVCNPDWAPDRGTPSPQMIEGGAEPEPEWLYRLATAGLAHRIGLLRV